MSDKMVTIDERVLRSQFNLTAIKAYTEGFKTAIINADGKLHYDFDSPEFSALLDAHWKASNSKKQVDEK